MPTSRPGNTGKVVPSSHSEPFAQMHRSNNDWLGTVDVTVVCVVDVKVCVAAPGQKQALDADSGHV